MSEDFLKHLESAKAFREGVMAERKRIVKIIDGYGSEDMTAELIAIIKGEVE